MCEDGVCLQTVGMGRIGETEQNEKGEFSVVGVKA